MDIPAFFTAYRDGGLKVTDGFIRGASPRTGTRMLDFKSSVSNVTVQDTRGAAVFIDCDSFSEGCFVEKVMKNLTVNGADIWFMTYISTVEDVFDAFNKDASMVLAPYHFVDSDREWKDICEVSDSVIPTVFVHNKKAIMPNGKTDSLIKVLDSLVSLGFYRNCVLDANGTLDAETWSVLAEDYPSTIPFVEKTDAPGFQTAIRPYLV